MLKGVYLIRCSGDNSVYVGQSSDLPTREKYHFQELRKGRHEVATLQTSWAIYGEESFTFTILDSRVRFDKKPRIKVEDKWIKHFRKDPNITVHNKFLSTEHPQQGTKASLETRRKQSQAKVGKEPHNKFPVTPEILQDIENGISYKAFEEKYGKSRNTLKRIKNEYFYGKKRVRVRNPELR